MPLFKKKETSAAEAKQRIWLLDALRGIAVFYMLFYHTLYDLAYIFPVEGAKELLTAQGVLPFVFGSCFVFLGGVTIRFSRNPAMHGARALLIAAAFTLVTSLFFAGSEIYFGVLHLYAAAMLSYAVLGKALDKIPMWISAPVFIVLFICTMDISSGYFGIKGLFELELPQSLYANNNLYPFGFIGRSFRSADYYPVFPWIFMFLAGSSLGRLFVGEKGERRELPEWLYKKHMPVCSFTGRHSLAIYVAHQPVIYAVLVALDYIGII